MKSETSITIRREDLQTIAAKLYHEIRDDEHHIAETFPGDDNFGLRMKKLGRKVADEYMVRIENVFLAKELFFGKGYFPIYAGHLSVYRSAAKIFGEEQ